MALDMRGGRTREAGERAGALDDRAPALAFEPRGRGRERLAGDGAVDGHGGLGSVGGRGAGDGGDVVEQRAVGVVADRRDHRHAQERHGAAQRLVTEREQIGERAAAARDHDHLDLRAGGQILQRARDRRGGVAVLHGRERPHHAPAPRAAAQAGDHVVACLAVLAADDADRARQGRAGEPALRLEQALGVQRAPQALELGQQVALAGDVQGGDVERERRRRGARARVVVAPAGRDDLHAVGQRLEPERVEVAPPHRARQRAGAVAQLEPHLRAAGLEAEHLAEHLHAREAAQALAQPGRVHAHRPRAGEVAAGDSGRALWELVHWLP